VTIYTFASNSFANQTNPPTGQNTFGTSCLASSDGSKFYVLFGSNAADEEDDADNCPFTVASFDGKVWTTVVNNGTVPAGRRGAGVAFYKNWIIAIGGSCGMMNMGPAVYRLTTDTLVWTMDTLNNNSKMTGPNVTDASVFVIDTNLYVVGGSPTTPEAAVYMYDLENFNWTMLSTPDTFLTGRSKAAMATMTNRVFILGGETDLGSYSGDFSQFVLENKCLGYKSCEDCTTQPANGGCGWCNANNDGYRCLAGGLNLPYVVSSCNVTTTYVSDIDFCPQAFPSYAIALLVIGGVVVIGVIIFAIMKVRSGEKQQEYEKIS